MSSEQLAVPDVTIPGEPVSHISNSSADNSRAQLVSSDVSRGPRRPSMTLETARRGYEHSDRHVRGGQTRVHRETEGYSEERGSQNTRRSVQHAREHYPRHQIVHDRIISNGHLQRENEHGHRRVSRHAEYSRHAHHSHSHRPTTEPRTLADLPVDAMAHRRREFQGVSSARTRGSNYDEMQDKDDRYIVPALPMPIAVVCCVLNFIIPGFGSMAASLCVFCCARTEDMTLGEKCGSCCTIFGIGVLQLLLVACFLIGWIWSCIWGITFIGMSASYYDDDEYYDDDYADTNTPARRGSERGRTPLPTPQVVVDQPYPGIRYEDIQRERNRRRERRTARSRISLTPSNVIYPMRAPSNIAYNSPPPPYQATVSPPPAYRRDQGDTQRYNDRHTDRHPDRRRQNDNIIHEEHG